MISEKYTDGKTKLFVECENGHRIDVRVDVLVKDKWCRMCAAENKPMLHEKYVKEKNEKMYNRLKSRIENKGGTIISTEYVGIKTKIVFECAKKHKCEMRPDHIEDGHWCRICTIDENPNSVKASNERNRIKVFDTFKDHIENVLFGTCHTTENEYKNVETRIEWTCCNDHKSKSRISGMCSSDLLCTSCRDNEYNAKMIEEMKEFAKKNGHEYLSKEYKGYYEKNEWKCNNGHIFYKSPYYAKMGHWCTVCKTNITENLCRVLMERMFDNKFPKIRPPWIKNINDSNLELDGYCEELNLAFEYNGEFHYLDVFGQLDKQQEHDRIKIEECEKKDVTLIVIPYTVKKQNIQQFIIDYCDNVGINIPNREIIEIDTLMTNVRNDRLKDLQDWAKKNKGEMITKSYLGCKQNHKFKCEYAHEFNLTYDSIKHKRWCNTCRLKKKKKFIIRKSEDQYLDNEIDCDDDTIIIYEFKLNPKQKPNNKTKTKVKIKTKNQNQTKTKNTK